LPKAIFVLCCDTSLNGKNIFPHREGYW